MADFSAYIPKLLKHEGGYANVAADKGGETYRGVSRVKNLTWAGWAIIDDYKRKVGPLKWNQVIQNAQLDALVNSIYKAQYWDKLKADFIKNQSIAEIMVDFYVNGGLVLRTIQKFVGVTADGIIGQQTVDAINKSNQEKLFNYIKLLRKKHYDNLVANDPTQRTFYEGWIERLDSFFFSGKGVAITGGTLFVVALVAFGIYKANNN